MYTAAAFIRRAALKCPSRDSLWYNHGIQQRILKSAGQKALGSGLQAAAVSGDGLIEGVVMPAHHFVCAVQWHPEFAPPEDAAAQKLFAAFVQAAAR